VNLKEAAHQKTVKAERAPEAGGEAPQSRRSGEASKAEHGNGSSGTTALMERVVERSNLEAALKRVKQNKGGPGIDGMTVEELPQYLKWNWEELKAKLLEGKYQPLPVREVEIPKGDGGVRKLGIPTVVDRFLQQSILQVLQPMVDPTFSQHSHGFRPGRSAHDAVREAQQYIQEGKRVVVDVDLEKFFDRVNHDVLMGRLARRIGDKRMLGLIRGYLNAGIMANGVVMERHEGTPEGGPLSPLLANVLLDEVDKELEKRGLSFVRYADDLNVYVGSMRAGNDAMELLKRLFGKLRLRINESKSAVDQPWNRTFLGYSFFLVDGKTAKRKVAPKALEKMKERVRKITGRNRRVKLEAVFGELRRYLPGWKQYFRLADTPEVFLKLDQWIRRRLRMVQLNQWKQATTVYREMKRLGASETLARRAAASCRHWWKTSKSLLNMALPNAYYARAGVPKLGA